MRVKAAQVAEEDLPGHTELIAKTDELGGHQQLVSQRIAGRERSIDFGRRDQRRERIGVVRSARKNAVGCLDQLQAVIEGQKLLDRLVASGVVDGSPRVAPVRRPGPKQGESNCRYKRARSRRWR